MRRPRERALFSLQGAGSVTAGAGRHHRILTREGMPLANVYVSSVRKSGEPLSLTVSHEVSEMLVDPAVNIDIEGARNVLYSYEIADAVEEDGFDLDGHEMSN